MIHKGVYLGKGRKMMIVRDTSCFFIPYRPSPQTHANSAHSCSLLTHSEAYLSFSGLHPQHVEVPGARG